MKIVLLGAGKTGSLVAEVARERGHEVEIIELHENPRGTALTKERLKGVGAVIDFTTPDSVMSNIEATIRAGCNMVVGTTGWYAEMHHVRNLVERANTGFLWASNFSIGVNLFFAIVREGAKALRYGYDGHVVETHHIHKLDAPSGTAVSLANAVEQIGGKRPAIESIREGEVVGTHTVEFLSGADKITLTHEAFSRRGFAEGAVRAAEWVKGKRGFYEFQEIFSQLKG
ncbi:MAG: dihydrodipicolinate reductase C-terminal domain-containing protein [Acidobacteriota bacterium]|nr:dihydrodipicolinate reductase C-terminal domain-containing protein [Acidobacteriota bacterium]